MIIHLGNILEELRRRQSVLKSQDKQPEAELHQTNAMLPNTSTELRVGNYCLSMELQSTNAKLEEER